MTPERWGRIRQIFEAAVETTPGERKKLLDRACGEDQELRREVDALLAADREASVGGIAAPTIAAVEAMVAYLADGTAEISEPKSPTAFDSAADLLDLGPGAHRYRILALLGEGGMGRVFRVHDRDLDREVALKVVKTDALSTTFLEEARVMARLDHPGIVPVLDAGVAARRALYYTMPLVRGRTLHAVLDELKRGQGEAVEAGSLGRRIQIFEQVAQAVSYAHSRGVVHRDLKPGNIMLGEHGEVQVLDWGLSRVLGATTGTANGAPGADPGRHIEGTPAYMSPEQARGDAADARSDVYALGAILYQMLTLERPFTGTREEMIEAALREVPARPSVRAPERAIPPALEVSCLKAMAKRPVERQASVEELLAEVRVWLEDDVDRARRHAEAEAKAEEGRARLEEYRRGKEEIVRLERAATDVARRFQPWQPVAEKVDLLEAERRHAAARRDLALAAAAVEADLEEALAFEAEHGAARRSLADYYWERFQEAEARDDEEQRRYFEKRVAEFHDGRYARALAGTGTLTLESEPYGADVWLFENLETGFVRAPTHERFLGRTPLGPVALAMGSYLVVLKREGYPPVRYPVWIGRNRDWRGRVRLYRTEEIGREVIYVPGGPFQRGGDPECRGWNLPRSEPWVDDFFIAEVPVTYAAYLEFLEDVLRREGPEAARRRSPLGKDEIEPLVLEPAEPVVGIGWNDAVAYCAWRSRRDRREYRLPSELEWEKAARGVDGRWFPWGDRFDAALCNTMSSRAAGARLGPVGEFGHDESIYGVRDMSGNVRCFTAPEPDAPREADRPPFIFLRGGGWTLGPAAARCAHRTLAGYALTGARGLTDASIGFRLVASAKGVAGGDDD